MKLLGKKTKKDLAKEPMATMDAGCKECVEGPKTMWKVKGTLSETTYNSEVNKYIFSHPVSGKPVVVNFKEVEFEPESSTWRFTDALSRGDFECITITAVTL